MGYFIGMNKKPIAVFFKPLIITIALIIWLSGASAKGAINSPVSYEQALTDAVRIAQLNQDWEVMRCSGTSMEPFYGKDSIILVDKADISELRSGMIAVYRDADGVLVAHKVINATSSQAWGQGFNNKHRDPDPITADNLTGVVFTILHTSGQPDAGALAQADILPVVYGKTYN